MPDRNTRTWSAPDGTRYRVEITEQTVSDGGTLRLVRRIEFATLDGSRVGATIFSGFLSLGLLNSVELERLWREAMGE